MNPTFLAWFPFYASEFLGSETVEGMTMTERGVYVTLMAMCWRDGSLVWDKTKLAKKLGIDQRTCGRFMEKYVHLTCTLHERSKNVPSTLHEPSMKVTFPKVQEFAETLRKNEGASRQRREEETRRDDMTADDAQASAASSLRESISSSSGTGENKPVPDPPRSCSPQPVASVSNEPNKLASALSVPAKLTKPVPNLNVRHWPDDEDRHGVPGSRIRNCISYQLDVKRDKWFLGEGYPTVSSLNSAGYVRKLNAETPDGWTPEMAVAEKQKKDDSFDPSGYETDDFNFDEENTCPILH